MNQQAPINDPIARNVKATDQNGKPVTVGEVRVTSVAWISYFQGIYLQTKSILGAYVLSFNGRTGDVKPVGGDYSVSQVTGAAPLNSPALTGVPTAPTAAVNTNTAQLATTAFVMGQAGGASTFLDLTDTPSTYTGQTGKAVVVNAGETGLEFTSIAGGTVPTGTGFRHVTAGVEDAAATSAVTTVNVTAPVASSGGATPTISMAAATDSVSGHLTAADHTTFNGKLSPTGSGQALTLSRLGASTYSTVQHLQDIFHSAGYVSGGTITDAGGGNINVAAGTGLIRATNSPTATISYFDWPASNGLAITSNAIRYVGVEYNAGTPQVTVRTSVNWNYRTDFPLGRVVNESGVLQIEIDQQAVGDHANNMIQREYETMPLAPDMRNGGLMLGETGTRKVTMTAGALWDRLNRYTLTAHDTSVSGSFDIYYRDGSGGFTKVTAQTQWPNTQYDDGTGTLNTLSANKWANLWFYIETDDDIVMLYGRGSYSTLAAASAEAPPSTIPNRLISHGRLIGRMLFQKSAATAGEIDSVFSTVFTSTGVTNHANLSNLDYAAAGHTGFVATPTPITPGTSTKVTYDANGFITSGTNATTADIAASANKNYVTDAQQTVIVNTSGTNTGDNAANSSTHYIGTTAIALNRASASQALTGITSIDGSSATCTGNAATASNLSGTPALPNGTTATTQAQADNSTKLATTAYVDTGLSGKAPTAHTQTASTITDFNAAALAAAPAETTTTIGSMIAGATAKATPVDADNFPLSDSAASNVLKKYTFANMKAFLKTYFDTLYPSGSGTSTGTNTGDQNLSGYAQVAGQIGGTSASPDVRGIRETSGPTLLTIGAIADGQVGIRSGTTFIGATIAGSGPFAMSQNVIASNATITGGYSVYMPNILEVAAGITLEIGLASVLEVG